VIGFGGAGALEATRPEANFCPTLFIDDAPGETGPYLRYGEVGCCARGLSRKRRMG